MKQQHIICTILLTMSSAMFFGCEAMATLFHGPKPEVTYTVTFDANGAIGTSPAIQTVNPGTLINLPAEGGLTSAGNVFVGWNTQINGGGTNYAAGATYIVTGHITLYAMWRKMEPEIEEFKTAGNHGYDFTKGFPVTIEIYALGAGGGGQGGHYSDVISTFGAKSSTGTGGAGGGGAATYVKFSVAEAESVTFTIKVGRGGTGGAGVSRSNIQEWQSGKKGDDGEETTVSWKIETLPDTFTDPLTITARGGRGGGGAEQILTGGSGGTANTIWPPGILASLSLPGGNGTNGTRGHGGGGDIESKGGNAASINIGSETLFGGGSGAWRLKGQRPVTADSGGGGSGEYSNTRSGSNGGHGHVIIIVTYNE